MMEWLNLNEFKTPNWLRGLWTVFFVGSLLFLIGTIIGFFGALTADENYKAATFLLFFGGALLNIFLTRIIFEFVIAFFDIRENVEALRDKFVGWDDEE